MGKLIKPQKSLFNTTPIKDVVYTPRWLAEMIVRHFNPAGRALDPCRGDGAFFEFLPAGADYCEIEDGKDFFNWIDPVDWIIGNPPYSCLLGWIRHSFKVGNNIVYLMPLHRVFASFEFLQDLQSFGGVKEILIIGTGTTAGFPFGHCLAAVHYQRHFTGETKIGFMSKRKPFAGV